MRFHLFTANNLKIYKLKKKKKVTNMITSSEYRVQCKIGEGSFSEVLKCVDRHSGICIAAKQLKRSFRR